jgi:HD-like signal output (HDOD) protein
VSGNGVSIHHNTLPEDIIKILENQNESIKKLQEQMEHLIVVVNKLNDKIDSITKTARENAGCEV